MANFDTEKLKVNDENFPPSDWVETTLGEVVIISSGKSRPKDKGIFPVYGGNGILDYADNFNFENETIIIGRVGAYCGCVYFETEKFWLSDNALGIKSNKKSDIKFLYYFLINQNLNKKAIGGAQPLLTQGILNQIEIAIPPLLEQIAIASVLSSFDDKIELLREQNKTLEEMGQVIFGEWFGKYGVDDELPEGWRIGKLGEVCEITSGKRPENISDIKTELHQIPLLGATKIMGFVENYLFDGKTLIIGRVGTHGEVQRFNEKIFPSDNTLVIKSGHFVFVYQILKSIDYVKMNRGAVQPLITQTDLKNYEIIIPSDEVLQNFKDATNPVFEKIDQNNSQIQSLSKSRDELLPRLMRGEVRVSGEVKC